MKRPQLVVVLIAVAVCGTALVAASGVGAAQSGAVKGDADVDVYAPNNILVPGTETELDLQVANDGTVIFGSPSDRTVVTTARNTRVEVTAGDAPVMIDTGVRAIGSVTESTPKSAPITVVVPESAEPGTYTLEAEIKYSHTRTDIWNRPALSFYFN